MSSFSSKLRCKFRMDNTWQKDIKITYCIV
jgi:hypothetical protein